MIRIDISDAIQSLDRLRQVMQRPQPFLQIIANKMQRRARISFEKEQSPEGKAWKPLSPRYAAWKTKHMSGRGILRKSGQLVKTIFTGTTARSAYISTANLPHAARHQYGFNGTETVRAHIRVAHKRRSINVRAHSVSAFSRHVSIPARPYLGFPPQDQREAAEEIAIEAEKIFEGKK
ncbi:MAG: phage virion morphogenesis protein [Acidobacteria bacterium]|nr:phage virion morphogenesis protein [Acidobacteriota bacterium]